MGRVHDLRLRGHLNTQHEESRSGDTGRDRRWVGTTSGVVYTELGVSGVSNRFTGCALLKTQSPRTGGWTGVGVEGVVDVTDRTSDDYLINYIECIRTMPFKYPSPFA